MDRSLNMLHKYHLASLPGAEEGEERAPGTHCLCMSLITTEFRGDRARTCKHTQTGDIINCCVDVSVGVLFE